MRLPGFGERLEPVGDLIEAFLAGGAGHARIRAVYSWVSLAIAALRLSPVGPIGFPVAGSPTSSRYSRWPCACPVSPSAVERNTAATSLKPSTCPGWVKLRYVRA